MANLPEPSASSPILPEPVIEVYINGVRQRSVIVSRITDSAGLEPARATLLYPTRDYLSHPCDDNDLVRIYVNKRIRPTPMFRGYVSGFGDNMTLESGEFVEVFCLDDVGRLQEGSVDRNYNILDTRGNYSEQLNIRQIAQDIINQINQNVSGAPTVLASSFPADFPGTVELLGVSYDSAFQQLLDFAGDAKYFLRRTYTENSTLVRTFAVGSGEVALLRRPTDWQYSAINQPDGVANVNVARREVNYADIVNKAVVVGDRKHVETALPLSKAWNADKESYLSDIEAFTTKGTEEDPNPDYDPEAERIGRAWRYGQVNTGRFLEYPELEPRLLVSPPRNAPNDEDDFDKPFVVYGFAGEGTSYVTYDIQINDNEIITAKPLVRDNVGAGAAVTPEVASAAYLECAFKLRSPLVATVAKQGHANRTVERILQRSDFRYQYQTAYFSVGLTPHFSATLNATVDQYVATYNAGTNVIRDDEATAQAWGEDRIRAMRDERLEITYELPRMDLGYHVGQRVRENGTVLDANIISIEYDLMPPYKTTITAATR